MQIQEGKFYRTRDGGKIGPAHRNSNYRPGVRGSHPWIISGWFVMDDGTMFGASTDQYAVAEWVDNPAPPAPVVLAEAPSITLAEVLRLAGGTDPSRVRLSGHGPHEGIGEVRVTVEPEKPIGVGDQVTFGVMVGTLVAVDGDHGWFKWDGRFTTTLLSELKRAEPGR